VNTSGRDEEVNIETTEVVYDPRDTEVDWTSFRWTRRFRVADGTEYTQQLRYGAMALGVQVETDSPRFRRRFRQRGEGRREPVSGAAHGRALRIAKPGDAVDARAMDQNWLLMVDGDAAGSIP